MNCELPDFYALEDALLRVDADFSAAEVHGINSAVLSINNTYDFQALKTQLIPGDERDVHYQEVSRQLADIYTATSEQLNANDLRFELLQPDEQDSLESRLLALQKWCQGFAYGLALSGLKSMEDLPEDSREWTQDVIKIGASGEFDLDDEEASETALLDISEFLRMGILMMNEEVQPMHGAPDMGTDDYGKSL
ncbi:MAG: UPF0149 family protein [Thiolinea sp.]